MKRLLLLFFLPCFLHAQWVTKDVVVYPVVETTKLDSLVWYPSAKVVRNGQHRTAVTTIDSFHTTQGSAVVSYRGKNPTAAAAVASIAVLQNMSGSSGIQGGTYLLSIATGDTLWTMSDTATNTGAAGLVNSDTLSFWAPAARFTSVRAGMQIQDSAQAGFPFMTRVDTVAADSNGFSIKRATLNKNANARVQFGYFTSTAYALGDVMGFPFTIPLDSISGNREYRLLQSAVMVDSSKQSDSLQLIFYGDTFTETTDNLAYAPLDADAFKVLGSVFLYPYIDFNQNSVSTVNNIGLALRRGPLYGLLFSRAGATTYLSSTALKLRLSFILTN